jgi:hypothetical protein
VKVPYPFVFEKVPEKIHEYNKSCFIELKTKERGFCGNFFKSIFLLVETIIMMQIYGVLI